ncbi:hypothetical protein HK102_004949 [Quaeritorhiza haematococci]|nr:hypothetical protein HK102_004949 [Quaeritorhiza haematococci]
MPGKTTFSEKTFHRNFEKTYGFLTPDQLPPIDWTVKSQLEMLFPSYKREQLAMDARGEQRSKMIEIKNFSLKTPLTENDFLFQDAKLIIEGAKRCALFGINGSGKTTLFEAMVNGELHGMPNFLHVHHMKELEHNEAADSVSVIDTVLCSHPFRRVLLAMRTKLKELIADAETPAEDLPKLEANLTYVETCLTTCHGDKALDFAQGMLRVLGFDEVGEKQPLSALSGGLRMRCALACAFFIDPDVLLLDEPTNHLDMPSVLWLENKLRGYKGSFLLVTHDRTLLENVVTSVMLIQDQKLEYFNCDFKEFEKRKEQNDKDKERQVDQFLARNKNPNPMSPAMKQVRIYQAWREARYQRNVLLQSKFTFPAPKPLPTPEGMKPSEVSLIEVKDVRFSYDEAKGLPFIFDTPISYNVKLSTRVGIMGPNGAGKSTFLKLITEKIKPTSGTVTINPDMTIAYFGQHSTKELNLEDSAIDFMKASFPKVNVGVLSQHLTKTSVGESAQQSRMKNLSFSQRSCVIFAKLTFVPPHLLILDEPTNFLDLETVESLISACKKFSGALITVTHNRDFLKKTSKQFLSIVPGGFLEFASMKEAERATYSFIAALEEGKYVDVKSAIQQNRGGGAIHSAEYLAAQAQRREAVMTQAQREAAEAKAEAERIEAEKAAKAEARKAKLAAQKTDWVAGDVCWAPVKGNYVQATVIRNVPGMGVTVELSTGGRAALDARKLKEENPQGGAAPAANGGPKANGNVKPNGTANGHSGPGSAGGRGGRGGQGGRGGRGGQGGRGGRGGRGRGGY